MPSTYCCVPSCKNKGGHRFPSEKTLKLKWVHAIKRDKWKPTDSSVVLKDHFKNTDYLGESFRYGTQSLIQKLRKDVVPSVFYWTTKETTAAFNRKQRLQNRGRKTLKPNNSDEKENICPESPLPPPCPELPLPAPCPDVGAEILLPPPPSCVDASVQTATSYQSENKLCANASSQTIKHCPFSIMTYKKDPQSIHFFTGLECFDKVLFVFQSLGDASQSLNYFYGNVPANIDPFEQFFLTLIILRTHKTFFEISKMYLISIKDVSNIFITWIKFMALQWKELELWKSKDIVKFFCPTDFYNKYPSTRLMIDGTECPIKRPTLPTAQQASFSSYKNRNTIKVLIGATPSGLINFVSQSYAGSASDRQIIELSNLSQMCDPGDSIMADKGFNVQDIFGPYGITINIPSFFKKSNKINSSNLENDRKIASKRVHIERVIGLLKTYKILQSPMNYTETMLSGDIIFTCCMLVNFRSSIIPKTA